MRRVTLYTRQGCHLCDAAEVALQHVLRRAEFQLEILDVDVDPRLRELYNEKVPVVAIDGVDVFQYAVDVKELLKRLA